MHKWINLEGPPEHLQGPEELRRRKEYLYETITSLISAVSYLHRSIDGFFTSHHDLKPSNILLFGERWKICDFGTARLRSLDEGSETDRTLGTFAYHPPEYEDKSIKGHGRSFDIWSMGCIVVELAVLIAYGWEGRKLHAFEEDRAKNRDRLSASSKRDVSFHNNMPAVRRWMERLTREDGSRNFDFLMETAKTMLSMDRDARPYSWEVEIYLCEQFHPNKLGAERSAKIRDLVQPPMKISRHNPLVRALDERNLVFVQFLLERGWKLGPSSSPTRSTNNPKNTYGDVVSMLESFTPLPDHIAELFKRAYEAQGYGSGNTANEGEQRRCEALAQKFAHRVAPARRTFWEIKHSLEWRHTLDSMKIFTEEVDVNQKDIDHGNTALFWASWHGEAATVDFLLQYGAEVDPINKLSETPLMVASMLGHASVVGRLLDEHNVKINYRDDRMRRTCLSYAAQFGRTEVVRILLESEADPQIVGIRGETPLSIAAEWGHKEIVELLLDLSVVDPMKVDNEGNSPLTHAIAEKEHRKGKGEAEVCLGAHSEIIELLKERDSVNKVAVRQMVRRKNNDTPR